jgi:FtsH-binding integral membrane protein
VYIIIGSVVLFAIVLLLILVKDDLTKTFLIGGVLGIIISTTINIFRKNKKRMGSVHRK